MELLMEEEREKELLRREGVVQERERRAWFVDWRGELLKRR